LSETVGTTSLGQNDAVKNAAWLLNTVQNGGNNGGFWASFKVHLLRKTCASEAETSASG